MPSCFTCFKSLSGSSWKVEDLGECGGRLGINGYFLSDETPNSMSCYCRTCWEKAVFNLKVVKSNIGYLQGQLNSSNEQLIKSEKSKTELQQQLTNVQQELDKFNIGDVQNLKNLLKQLDNDETLILQNVGSFNINEFECEHIAHQHTVAKLLVKEAMQILKVGVKKVIEYQTDQLSKRQQGLQKCIEVMNG